MLLLISMLIQSRGCLTIHLAESLPLRAGPRCRQCHVRWIASTNRPPSSRGEGAFCPGPNLMSPSPRADGLEAQSITTYSRSLFSQKTLPPPCNPTHMKRPTFRISTPHKMRSSILTLHAPQTSSPRLDPHNLYRDIIHHYSRFMLRNSNRKYLVRYKKIFWTLQLEFLETLIQHLSKKNLLCIKQFVALLHLRAPPL
jgi:hypothetical protein